MLSSNSAPSDSEQQAAASPSLGRRSAVSGFAPRCSDVAVARSRGIKVLLYLAFVANGPGHVSHACESFYERSRVDVANECAVRPPATNASFVVDPNVCTSNATRLNDSGRPPEKGQCPKQCKAESVIPRLKNGIRVWSWNVETVCQPGLLLWHTRSMAEHNVDVLFLQETRLKGSVCYELDDFFFAKIGGPSAEDGVGVLVAPHIKQRIIGIKLVSPRLMRLCLRSAKGPVYFHNVHVPQEGSPTEAKNCFWKALESEFSCIAAPIHNYIVGDLNVRWESVLPHESDRICPWVGGKGREWLTSRPFLNNRERAWEALVSLDLIDMNSRFQKLPRQMYTYRDIGTSAGAPPHLSTHATLDRLWTRPQFRSSVRDVSAIDKFRNVSHHIPLECIFVFKFSKQRMSQKVPGTDISRLLNGDEAPQLRARVRENMLSSLPDPDDDDDDDDDDDIPLDDLHSNNILAASDALLAVLGKREQMPSCDHVRNSGVTPIQKKLAFGSLNGYA